MKIFPQLNRWVAWALTALGVFLLLKASGCSIFRDIIKEHDQVCAKNIKVIVHDSKLWQEYRGLAEVEYQKARSRPFPQGGRMMLQHVEGFEQRFGENIKTFRPYGTMRAYADNQIIRDDLFLIKGEKFVLQVIDYIGAFGTIANLNGLDCLGRYGTLYIKDELR